MNNNFFIIGKSAVNFCELDLYIYGIGEIWNVLSSFVIVFFGLYGLYNINYNYIHKDNISINLIKSKPNIVHSQYIISYKYIKKENQVMNLIKIKSNILYLLLTLIGFGSVYFHYELSPFAHWIDIIFISMILVYTQYILSLNFNSNVFMHKFKYIILMFGHFITSIYIPHIHIFLLFATGFIVKKLLEYKIDKSIYLIKTFNYNELIKKYWWIKKYFNIALVFWIIDFFGCSFITPYHVHWIFHIFIGLMAYKIIDLLKYI